MQFHGRSLADPITCTVTLPRPDGDDWSFTLRPLPLGFHRRLRQRGVIPPAAPVRVARDSQGRPLRDEAGVALTLSDAADPTYAEQLELHHQRVAVLAIAEALAADGNVRLESAPPGADAPASGWLAYADAVYAELEDAGFTAGDLLWLCNAIGRISNLCGEHLQQARANFSSPRAGRFT